MNPLNNLKQFSEDDTVYISVDAEWYKKQFLTVQLAISNKAGKILQYYIFINNQLPFAFTSYKDVPVEVITYPLGERGIMDYFEEVPLSIRGKLNLQRPNSNR